MCSEGLSPAREIAYARKQRERDLFLIFVGVQQCCLLRIGKEAAFCHDRGIFTVIAQEKLLAALLYLSVVSRLKKLRKALLEAPGKVLAAAVGGGIEHLRSAVFRLGELILVYGYAHCVVVFVEQRKAVVHVGALLAGQPLHSLVVDRYVSVPCDLDIVAAYLQQVPELQQYAQVYALFRHALCGGAAAVEAAVWRVNLNRVVFLA